MQNDNVPIIEPINVRQFEFKQSKYEHADKLPFRSIVVSASQGGKGILIQISSLRSIVAVSNAST